jgi:protein MpaA
LGVENAPGGSGARPTVSVDLVRISLEAVGESIAVIVIGDNKMLVERSDMGIIRHASAVYGKSREGNALTVWLPKDEKPAVLVLASMHGDESETTVVLSDALRSIRSDSLKNAAILCANPDGLMRGTRGNANGVDLNRNFPSSNWSPEPVFYKSRKNDPQDIALSPGPEPGSEPETRALISLLDRMKPRAVIALHSALACIDDLDSSFLAQQLSERSGLPLEIVSYATLGSFGSWAEEQELNLVTYELEPASPYDLKDRHVPVLIDVLTGKIDLEGP